VLDVGTGAGLPGIPLAIAHPGLLFSLIDTNGKKTRFLKQISGELGLSNVEVIKGRVEQLDRPGHYARITARAFSDMARLVTLTERLLAADGCWLAMKGTESHEEQTGLPPGLTAATVRLQVPGEPGRRHLVILQHTGDSQAAD
jgi:16S rRNA (guanine527-N7)-methyltransferase